MTNKPSIKQQMPLGRHLAILTKMYYGALSKQLEHLEIEKHYSVLVLIENSEHPCTQQYISDTLKIDKASMVSVIDYLSEKKLIKRTNNPADRRAYWIELTPKAHLIMPELHEKINELNKVALKGLNKTQALEFNKALCLISENLDNLPSDRVIINFKKVKKNIK